MISQDLKKLIRNLYGEYGSYRKVARFAGVSDKTVRAVMLDLHKKEKKKPGPSPSINPREERRIKRETTKLLKQEERVTAAKIQRKCQLERVSKRTVQRKLKSMGNEFKTASKEIVLNEAQKSRRLELARTWLAEPRKTRNVT